MLDGIKIEVIFILLSFCKIEKNTGMMQDLQLYALDCLAMESPVYARKDRYS